METENGDGDWGWGYTLVINFMFNKLYTIV